MAIQRRNPRTIYLGGGDGPGGESGMIVVNDYVAGTADIKPGMLIETYRDGDATKWRPHSDAAGMVAPIFALEQLEWNLGIDDVYGLGDLVKAGHMKKGSTVYALVPSGQDVASEDYLQSNGDGNLKEATASTAAANVAKFKAKETIGAVTEQTRCRIEVL